MEIENENLKKELNRMKNEYNRVLFLLERSYNEKLRIENEKLMINMENEKLKTENEKLMTIVDNVKNLVNNDPSKKRKAENDHYPFPSPFSNTITSFSFAPPSSKNGGSTGVQVVSQKEGFGKKKI